MSWRLFAVVIALLSAALLDVVLLVDEEIAEADRPAWADPTAVDPLIGMRFTPASRHSNLSAMGFDEGEVAAIEKEVARLSRVWSIGIPGRDVLRARFEASPEETEVLSSAFCGTGVSLPPRYAVLGYLLDEDPGGLRHVVDLDATGAIEFQEWTRAARIEAVYQSVERQKQRKPDATRMGLAAILSANEDALLEGTYPWGDGLLTGWSWEKARESQPGLGERLTALLGLMVVSLESATAEGGICPRTPG